MDLDVEVWIKISGKLTGQEEKDAKRYHRCFEKQIG